MSTRPEELEEQIRKTAKMVRRWHGYPAGMFSLTPSLAALYIVVFGKEAGQNLVIACLGPEHICGPFRWRSAEISVRVTQLGSGTPGVAVADERSGLLVTSETFGVHEHVKKLHGVLVPPMPFA